MRPPLAVGGGSFFDYLPCTFNQNHPPDKKGIPPGGASPQWVSPRTRDALMSQGEEMSKFYGGFEPAEEQEERREA
jgi:hypothetical protein